MTANPATPVDVANIAKTGGAVTDAPPDGTDPTTDRSTANESATALVALADVSSSEPSPPTPPESSADTTGTLSVAQVQPPPDAPRYVPPDEAAHAWIDHVEKGGSVPDGPTFVALLRALAAPRVPHPPHPNPVAMASLASVPDVRLILVDTSDNKKFPHMLDTQNGRLTDEEAIWTQCKTKMTHVAVRLVDKNGNPAKGKDVCEGGLLLRLTLHLRPDAIRHRVQRGIVGLQCQRAFAGKVVHFRRQFRRCGAQGVQRRQRHMRIKPGFASGRCAAGGGNGSCGC